MLHENLTINSQGRLCFAGRDTVELAEKYSTPLMLMDEDRIRFRMSEYLTAIKKAFTPNSYPLYASKALCNKQMYRIAKEEGIGIDLVSPGELYTAIQAGFDLSRAYFHGNNKTDEDIIYAIENGVGYFIVDNREELDFIDYYAGVKKISQKILMRLTPGIDPHTHQAISTGKVDSKFGTAIETGQADELIACALTKQNITLMGFHCHVGSQIFEIKPFCDAADIMVKYLSHLKNKFGFETKVLNLGGGFGVRYVEEHPHIDYTESVNAVAKHVKAKVKEYEINMPDILMEPGRSMVADCGITLYTVGSVKNITGYKSYVSVDGGMTDNPRYALYQSEYTTLIANKADKPKNFKCTIAGRCCESGDLLQENVLIQTPQRGDVLAVLVTGAYNYAMASNYNKIPRPPIVMIKGGEDYVAVRRETFEDIARLDN